MSSKTSMAKESVHGVEKRAQTQQGSGTLWSNQGEMKRYVTKLKSELDEQKSRVKRVHRDKTEEIKRLQANLDNERQKAIENVAKKLENDKAYEMKKLRETVVKQKESELRQALRLKDEEIRTLKQEVQECKNSTRIVEMENKRMLNERLREDVTDTERRLRNEVTALKQEKRKLEESLRLKTQTDSEKAEVIRKMKYEHDSEVQRLTRDSKRESFKEFRHLKAVSKEIEVKNHQLAAKELEMRHLEEERNALGNKLNMQRKKVNPDVNSSKNDSFNLQNPKGVSVSHISESDFESVAEGKIKKLKMRNSELVGIARKLEEKAKRLQEEKDILEKSSPLYPEMGSLKKAFARQRAKDLAEHAKLLMNKDSEINNLRQEVQRGTSHGSSHNENINELEKIVQQTAKEHLLLEKQLSSKEEVLMEEIEEIRSKNLKLTNDNEMLKEDLCKLQDVEAKQFKTMFEMNQIIEERDTLQHASSEKDKKIYKLELEKQTLVAKNNALQKKNNELSHKIDQFGKFEAECKTLKENLQTLKHDHEMLTAENNKLRAQVDGLLALKKEMGRLQKENLGLQNEKEDSVFKLEECDKEISRLHQVQDEAQKKHDEQVSELDEMVRRLKEQSGEILDDNVVSGKPSLELPVLSSTPKHAKCTQTSRPSSPTLSPITDHQSATMQEADEVSETNESHIQDSLRVPDYATSSSTSFDLEKASTRIEQLAVSDSDEIDFRSQRRTDSPSVSSEISDDTEEEVSDNSVSEDTSYGADVSRTSDLEESDRSKEKIKEEIQNCEDEDSNVFIGSKLYEAPDVEDKLSIFIAKYSYDPMLYSPNDNPETELAFQAGDYLYVFGDVDEDGFFIGELMNGERGLVPSNFIERIAEEDEAILKESNGADDDDNTDDDSSEDEIALKDEDGKRKVIHPKAFSERRHEMFRTSLDYMLNDQLDDIRESEEDDLGNDVGGTKHAENSDGLDSMDSDVPTPRVPSPTKLSVDRQFTNSALISWRASPLPCDEIQGYNIYVDGKLKSQTKGSEKTNALVEDINPEGTYRLSVRTKSVNGGESPDYEATVVLGAHSKLSPYDLRVLQITQTSAEIHWIPSNSSYSHDVFLDDSLLSCVKPTVSSFSINELSPLTLYHAKVRTQVPNHVRLALGKDGTEDNLSSEIEFTTSVGGLPEPPVNLRLERQTAEEIILTWLPVTISQSGYSNGFKVSGYKVYVNGIYCMETDSAAVDSLSITNERLRNLGKRHDLTCMQFVVRTLSVLGESADSNVVEVLPAETSGSAGKLATGGRLHSEGNETRRNSDGPEKDGMVKGDDEQLNDIVPNALHPSTSLSDKLPTGSGAERHGNVLQTPDLLSDSDPTKVASEDCLRQQLSRPPGLRSAGENSAGNGKVTEQGTEQGGDPSEESGMLPPEGRRKPVVVRYDVDDDDETETESCTTAESKTETEEESVEVFVDPKKTKETSKGVGDVVQANDLAPSTVTKDDKRIPSAGKTCGGEQTSESETDTDYDETLSVIVEVDEEYLSETNSNSSPKRTKNASNNEESPVSKFQEISVAVSSPDKNSTCSGSKTRTLSSEDEGFRTDDDVLDLLDDDDDHDDFGKVPVEKHVDGLRTTQNNAVLSSELEALNHCKNISNKQINSSVSPPDGRITEISDKLRNDDVVLSVENEEKARDLSETLEKLKVDANENITSEESIGNISESSFPTKTSVNSESSSTLSDTPLSQDENYDAILKTLSVPGNREPAPDESESNDYLGKPELHSDNSRMQSETSDKSSELVRYFVALYNYDPSSMSPNSDGAEEELAFNEGDLIKVFEDKDDDGFFWGECKGQQGYVPSNMVSEVAIDEAEDMFNEETNSMKSNLEARNVFAGAQTNGHSELDVDVISEDYTSSDGTGGRDGLAFLETLENGDLGPRKMRALFDYDPVRDSPNVDSEVELMFKTGEIVYVFGDMDDDGFYQGELQGIRGLVPSNFLKPDDVTEFATHDNVLPKKRAIGPATTSTSQKYAIHSSDLPNGTSKEQEEQQKKKKGIFSKGKKMFKKAFR